MAGITSLYFHQNNGCIGFIILKKHLKRLRVQVSITFIAKDIAIIRILVTGGGHLEFPHENVPEKNWKQFFFQLFRVSISEKSQLFKIYIKKSQNDTMTYT